MLIVQLIGVETIISLKVIIKLFYKNYIMCNLNVQTDRVS